MSTHDLDFYIRVTQGRLEYLNLSPEQALKIYEFGKEQDGVSGPHFFTTWEELDYELTVYQEILNQDQLKLYLAYREKTMLYLEQTDQEADKRNSKEIAYWHELNEFYENDFLPDIFKNHLLRFGWLLHEKGKIDYLKTEYKRFLKEKKKEILTQHFRHYRTNKPLELKANLLKHHLNALIPDLQGFSHWMDDATKAVLNFLKAKFQFVPKEMSDLILEKDRYLKEHQESIFKKYYKDFSGWHIEIPPLSPEKEMENAIITYLLMDKNKYESA